MSEINRQLSNSAAISYRNQLANKSLRRARTRTLIQAGGLLNLLGFFTICGIEEGQDLQLDFENQDKAAILLGILSEAFERLPIEPSSLQLECWKNIGIRVMKMRSSVQKYEILTV
jgi:hypothetical protein